MKLIAFATAATTALLLAACASGAPVVQTDHAPNVNFAQYKTYSWVEMPQTQSPLMQDKLVNAIDAQLSAKGYRRVPEGGDVAVLGSWDSREEVSYSGTSFGFGIGGWGSNSGGGIGTSTGSSKPKSKFVGTLAVDLFDSKTKQALWRGTVTGDIPASPQAIDAEIAKVIPQMFAKFPPP